MISYIFFLIAAMFMKSSSQNPELISLPVTFYSHKMTEAPNDFDSPLYYQIQLCEYGIANNTQAMLLVSLPNNVQWNTVNAPFVIIQVSTCINSFTENCVIAQNYIWDINVTATPIISWNIGDEKAYYLRILAGYQMAKFSLELSFTNNITPFSYKYQNKPFVGTEMTTVPATLDQYWKSTNEYTGKNDQTQYFSLQYCDQGMNNIVGINVAISTPVSPIDFSLIQQWACTQKTRYQDCKFSNNDWINQHVASFNMLTCDKKDTSGGIYIGVAPDGANSDGMNTYIVDASVIYT